MFITERKRLREQDSTQVEFIVEKSRLNDLWKRKSDENKKTILTNPKNVVKHWNYYQTPLVDTFKNRNSETSVRHNRTTADPTQKRGVLSLEVLLSPFAMIQSISTSPKTLKHCFSEKAEVECWLQRDRKASKQQYQQTYYLYES